jgi:hypothetical protein
MSQQSAFKRPRKKLWQFSIAQLLVLTFLIAVVAAAFRWDTLAGVIASFICIAILIVVNRTKLAIRQQEPPCVDNSHSMLRKQSILLAIWSTLIVFPAMALCLFGVAGAFTIGAIVFEEFHAQSPFARLHVDRVMVGFIFLVFVPLTVGTVWIWFTWAISKRAEN